MKKIIFLLILLLSIQLVAAETSIYDFVDSIVNSDNADGYQIVVGDEAPAADVRTTNELVSNFNNMMSGTLGYDLASSTFTDENLILLGNPCDNPKLDEVVQCETWPYEDGEALVKVSGNNLIIAGANPDDTRMAADAIIDYKNNEDFKTKSEVMISGMMDAFEVKEVKEEIEVVCGDGKCSPGEKETCLDDCLDELSCDALCKHGNFLEGICREVTETAACMEDEVQKGLRNCENMQMCCCKTEPVVEEPVVEVVSVVKEPKEETVVEKPGIFDFIADFFKNIINWFKNLF